jgi:hypothetical protein
MVTFTFVVGYIIKTIGSSQFIKWCKGLWDY